MISPSNIKKRMEIKWATMIPTELELLKLPVIRNPSLILHLKTIRMKHHLRCPSSITSFKTMENSVSLTVCDFAFVRVSRSS